jgi:hypothetical protein
MIRHFRALLLLLLIAASRDVNAQTPPSGRITYLTSSTAYVDLGTNQGVDVGDTLLVTKDGRAIARLLVSTVASKSLSATILSKTQPLAEGDAVIAVTVRAPRQATRLVTPDTAARAPSTVATATPPAQPLPATSTTSNVFHGRVGMQYHGMYNDTRAALDFSQPAMVLNFIVDRIGGAPLQFSYYSNSRYDALQQQSRSGVGESRLNNRVYEAVLRYGDEQTPVQAWLGRFVAPAVGGVGTFDGAMGVYRNSGLQAGLVGGSQPGWQRSDVQLTNPKYAAFVAYDAGDYNTTKYQGSAAYAQQYYQSKLDRGFFYIQNSVYLPNSLSLWQNANFDMHDLANGVRTTSLHLTDFFLSASYRPMNWFSTSGSWSYRRNIFFLSSFSGLPDSLFDRSAQQNFQLGASMRLPLSMYLSLNGGLRTKEGDARNATSIFANYSWADILGTRFGSTVTATYADNVYNVSRGLGVDVHTDIIEDLYLSAKANWSAYEFSAFARAINRATYGADAYYRLSKAVYISLSFERYVETSFATQRIYGDVTLRF